jgi:hypothetical protein
MTREYIRKVTKAATHPERSRILRLLQDSPKLTADLLQELSIPEEEKHKLYHHLNVLIKADLIDWKFKDKEDKKTKIYALKEHKRPLAAVVIFDEEDIKSKRKEFEAMIDLMSAMEGKEIPFKRRIARAEICLYFKESK